MTANQTLARNLVAVVATIGLVTTLALVLAPAPTPSTGGPVGRTRPGGGQPRGELVFAKKGCAQCHSVDGTRLVGPSLRGSFGTTIALEDGRTVVMDEDYIRESLARPQAKARPGYPSTMPSFDGLLQEREIEALIEYVKSLHQDAAN